MSLGKAGFLRFMGNHFANYYSLRRGWKRWPKYGGGLVRAVNGAPRIPENDWPHWLLIPGLTYEDSLRRLFSSCCFCLRCFLLRFLLPCFLPFRFWHTHPCSCWFWGCCCSSSSGLCCSSCGLCCCCSSSGICSSWYCSWKSCSWRVLEMKAATPSRLCCLFAYLCNKWLISALMLLRWAGSILQPSIALQENNRALTFFAITWFCPRMFATALKQLKSITCLCMWKQQFIQESFFTRKEEVL